MSLGNLAPRPGGQVFCDVSPVVTLASLANHRLISFHPFWVFAGIVLGIGGALALTKVTENLFYGVRPTDPWIYVVCTPSRTFANFPCRNGMPNPSGRIGLPTPSARFKSIATPLALADAVQWKAPS